MNAVLAITDPGRRDHPAGAVLLQSRDGGGDGRRDGGRACRRRASYQLDVTAIAQRDHAAHARHRHRLAEQPDRRGLSRGGAARGQRALPRRAASSTSTTRPTSTSPTAASTHFSPGSTRRAPPATRSRSTRCRRRTAWRAGAIGYMVIPDGAGRGGQQDPGHDPDLPARGLAACGAGGAAGRPGATPRAHLARLDATRRAIFEALERAGRALRRAVAGRRVLLPRARALDAWTR